MIFVLRVFLKRTSNIEIPYILDVKTLTLHLLTKSFKCGVCDYNYSLKSYILTAYEERRPFECDFCEMSLSQNICILLRFMKISLLNGKLVILDLLIKCDQAY